MHYIEKKIDGLAIDLGKEYCICAADVEFCISYLEDGNISVATVKIYDIYYCGPNGKERKAEADSWDLTGLKEMVFESVDWNSEAELVANYQEYSRICIDEYENRKYNLAYNK